MARTLPTPEEAALILARRRTRPIGRAPPAAGRALGATLKALEARFGTGAEGLKARWTEIVGEALARRTEPVRLSAARAGSPARLEIRVDGPSAILIQHQAADILARVNLYLGEGSAERLRVVQGPLRRAPRAVAAARPKPRGPLDAAAEQALARSLADAPEGRLKDALTRLGREVMRSTRP